MKIKRMGRKKGGMRKRKVPRLLKLNSLKKRVAEIRKRKAGLYRRFRRRRF